MTTFPDRFLTQKYDILLLQAVPTLSLYRTLILRLDHDIFLPYPAKTGCLPGIDDDGRDTVMDTTNAP